MESMDFSSLRTQGTLPDPRQIHRESIIEDLWEPYVDSVTSLLSQLEESALALESGRSVQNNCAIIRRVLHSIKGDSGMSGLMDVYALCHEAESAFEEIPNMSDRADMVLRVKDWIENAIESIRQNTVSTPVSEPVKPRKIKTLVIDDDPVCRQRLKMILQQFCECDFANDGKEGYELFQRAFETGKPYQLVTLDIQMPDMDGHETLSAIRLLERQRGIEGLDGVKIIMITSQHQSSHIFSAFRGGCEAYVVKTNLGEKLPEEMANLGLLTMKPNYSLR